MPEHLKKRVVSPKISPESADFLADLPWGEASPLVDDLITRHRVAVEKSEGKPPGTFEILYLYEVVSDLIQALERRRDYHPETGIDDGGTHWTEAEASLHRFLNRVWDEIRTQELFIEDPA